MIQVQNLNKNFKVHKKEPGIKGSLRSLFARNHIEKHALKDLNLTIEEGEIVGLIGSNGAGKTTLTKILSGIIHPSSGIVKVMGHNPWKRNDDYRRQMSVIMGQKAQLWWDLPAHDGFLLLREIYQIDKKQFQKSLDFLSSVLDVTHLLNIQVRRLSLGERMKVELIAALLHRPKIIFLDEPTIGLDLSAQKSVRKFIKEYRKEFNPTMILTSHYMDDIEELCPRICILKEGQKVYDGMLDSLHQKFANQKLIKANLKSLEDVEVLKKTFPKHLGSVESFNSSSICITTSRDMTMEAAKHLLSSTSILDLNIQEEEVGPIIEKIQNGSQNA